MRQRLLSECIWRSGIEPRLSQIPAPRANHFLIKLRAGLQRTLLCLEVDVDDAEALRIAQRPFEIVEKRPDAIAAQVDAFPDGLTRGAQVLSEIVDPQRIVDAAVSRRRIVE